MSAVADTQVQGNPMGEPAAPEAIGSGDAELLAAAYPSAEPSKAADDAWLKNLESVDLDKLPKSFVAKVEQAKAKSLDADYTRKTQALAERERQILDWALKQAGKPDATPDTRAALLERVKQGDLDVLDQYVAAEVGPLKAQMALQNAYQQAVSLDPYVKEREADVAQILSGNPLLQEMARADNYRYMPVVLQGAALSVRNQELTARLAEAEKSIEARIAEGVKKGIEEKIAQARGLPQKTSMAGTTPSGSPASTPGLTLKQRQLNWLRENGLPIDPAFAEEAERGR